VHTTSLTGGFDLARLAQFYNKGFMSILYDNMFYTNAPKSGIIVPMFISITAYDKAIEEGKKKLADLTHQQFQGMLKSDVPAMNALEKQYKDTERYINSLKAELGEVMGAGIHGKKGNQLTGSGWFGRKMAELSAEGEMDGKDGKRLERANRILHYHFGDHPAY